MAFKERLDKPIVLHIGDPIKYNLEVYSRFASDFTVIRPSEEERERYEFMKALREKRWGEFSAIFRPFWGSGGEMGRWDQELIPLLPKSVKVFASAGAGFDWADVDVLADHGILYCNSAGASTEAVADFAIFGILSTFRQLTWCTQAAHSTSRDQFFDCHHNATVGAHNPRGHNLGVIGLGNIGYQIAKKAYLAFGMNILYHDVIRKDTRQEAEIQAKFHADLASMLEISDCVVLATPSSPDRAKLILASNLSQFKDGSRFINIARGNLVDEESLADALDSGKLSAAFLDVHEREPEVNPRLVGMRNVTLTCHNAGGTMNTYHEFERMSMQNIEAVLKGNEPMSPVNRHLMKQRY
ncbi:MAG: hypothetical protein M1818_002310 [Claussenomyces sp. TS43310]|nr:MAG: hypothetical protein M1818_002310 [Claussenomyces sp. TS43310]